MGEWLKPISGAVRYGLAGAIVATPMVACKLGEPAPRPNPTLITRPVSDVFPPYACTPLNTILSADGKIPVFDVQRSKSNALAEIGIPAIMSSLASGKYRLDYYQIGLPYPSQTRIERNVSGGLDIKHTSRTTAEILPQWVLDAAKEAQTPLVVTSLQELQTLQGEDGKYGSTYVRTVVGFRHGIILELPFPVVGEFSAREVIPGAPIVWGYDRTTIQDIVAKEVNLLEEYTTVGAGLYHVDGYCIQETPTGNPT